MAVFHFNQVDVTRLRPGVERRIAHGDHLMMVIIDFKDGPKPEPDPPHSHPHEQVTYVAVGEVAFFLEGEETHLSPGDMVVVPSGKPHSIQLLSPYVRLVDCFTPLREDFLS